METALLTPTLEPQQFDKIRQLLYRLCGIRLQPGKEELVKARLSKRLRTLGLPNFAAYLDYIEQDGSGQERLMLIDALTTNKTSFFREPQHFEFLRQHVLPSLQRRQGPLRFWSAGCASGEEPYTLAILLCEHLPEVARRNARILATDISTRVLAIAKQGLYSEETLRDVPMPLVQKYFSLVPDQRPRTYRVHEQVRSLVRFARLNLMAPWPMRGPFDVIFCRNVMIYFDKSTQQQLVQRFWELLAPGGYLCIGHAESLAGAPHAFQYVQPAIYRKERARP